MRSWWLRTIILALLAQFLVQVIDSGLSHVWASSVLPLGVIVKQPIYRGQGYLRPSSQKPTTGILKPSTLLRGFGSITPADLRTILSQEDLSPSGRAQAYELIMELSVPSSSPTSPTMAVERFLERPDADPRLAAKIREKMFWSVKLPKPSEDKPGRTGSPKQKPSAKSPKKAGKQPRSPFRFDGPGDPVHGVSTFVALAPKQRGASLTAKNVFDETVIPYLRSIGVLEGEARKRIYVPSGGGVPRTKTDLEGLLRLRCKVVKVSACKGMLSAQSEIVRRGWLDREVQGHVGLSFEAHSKALSRVEREFPFFQTDSYDSCDKDVSRASDKTIVPFEHAGFRVTALDGETPNSLMGKYYPKSKYNIVNCVGSTPDEIVKRIPQALGISQEQMEPINPSHAQLLLLPVETAIDQLQGQYKVNVRFVYRFSVVIKNGSGAHSGVSQHYLWIDAGKVTHDRAPQVLQWLPLGGDITVTGNMMMRDPSTGEAPLTEFELDNPAGTPSALTLQLSPQFSRLDRYRDGSLAEGELSALTSDFSNSASPNFQEWLERRTTGGGVPDYQCMFDQRDPYPGIFYEQIDLMATLAWRWRELEIAGGLLSGFPGSGPIKVIFNGSSSGCDLNTLADAYGGGPSSPARMTFNLCKRLAVQPVCSSPATYGTNPIHDHTVVSHEFGHILTSFQYRTTEGGFPAPTTRSGGWCGALHPDRETGRILTGCPIPELPYSLFHDFADAWAHHFEDTPCVGGWVAKDELNTGNNELSPTATYSNPSLNCARHSEEGGLPRLSHVGAPDVVNLHSTDRFPEHVRKWNGPYARMQVASAALWSVREGMRSHLGALLGPAEYFRSFVRTLAATGWVGPIAQANFEPEHVYRGLLDLEVSMANEWVKSPPSGTAFLLGKITAGFAKAGVFMIPPGCLDAGAVTDRPEFCAGGLDGGDAVIDIDDNDPSDDEIIAPGLAHEEGDYLKRSGGGPSFLIWTGPGYTFDGGQAVTTSPACNRQYKVELSTDKSFSAPTTNGWQSIPSGGSACFVRWTPSLVQWNNLKGSSGTTRIYYRLKTRQAPGSPELVSTLPARGLFRGYFVAGHIPPPYAIVNDTGRSEDVILDTEPPSVPANLSVVGVSPSQIKLSWNASTDNVGVSGYLIFRNQQPIGQSLLPVYADNGLNPGVSYSYEVSAVDPAGNRSIRSMPVVAQTKLTQDVTPPHVPGGVSIK